MTPIWRCWWWKLGLASWLAMGGAIALFGNCALAQNITLDGSLGSAGTLTGPDYVIPQAVGQTAGNNLFHSFGKFSLDTGESAGFESAANIRNILSRVTGGSASLIDGLIYTQSSSVNLFLINPSGIVFGSNASIDVGGMTRGSFVATTVDALVWPDGSQFNATNSGGADSLLSIVGDPSGFLASLRPPAPITVSGIPFPVSGSFLQVYNGQSLVLLGGEVNLNDTNLFTLGGRVELGGVSGAGTVGLNVDGNRLNLSFPDGLARADVSLTSSSIEVAFEDGDGVGGDIAIHAQNLDISGSALRNGIEAFLGSVGSQAGDITLNATGEIKVASSNVLNTVRVGAVGNGGDINIVSGSLSLTEGAQLFTRTNGQGNAGSIAIDARDTISFDGFRSDQFSTTFTTVFSGVGESGTGQGGDIRITTGSLSLTNSARLASSTLGQGDAGSVTIVALNTVSLDGGTIVDGRSFPSAIFGDVGETAVGQGGDIRIATGSLFLTNEAVLLSSVYGQVNAGDITIDARDTVSLDGNNTAAFSNVETTGRGQSGDIRITTGSLSLTNGAELQALTRGQGDAGSITIDARNAVSFDGVGSNGFPSGAFSSVESGAVGNGGGIDIATDSLSVTNGALLSTRSEGSGPAGNIEVEASSIRLNNQAFLSSDTTAGQGNINLRSEDLVLRRGSNITTNATDTVTGGNITIDTDILVALENSDISANAEEAFGGQVIIDAQGIFGTQFRNQLTPESDITATSDLGPEFSGTVEINTPDVDPSQGLATLPTQLVEASGLIATGCAALGENEFIVTGRGGLPENPSDPLSSDAVQVDLVTLNPTEENRSNPTVSTNPTSPTPGPLVEAQGWVINDKGEVVLTAHAPNVTSYIPWMNPATCHTP